MTRIVVDPPQFDATARLMGVAADEILLVESTLAALGLPETPADVAAVVEALVARAERAAGAGASAIRSEAAQLELRVLITQGCAPVGFGLAGIGTFGWLERGIGLGGNVAADALAGLESIAKHAKPVRVSGYWRGATWVASYNRRLPGQARLAGRLRLGGGALAFTLAGVNQYLEDAGGRFSLGERLTRAATAGGVSAGTGVALGAGAEVGASSLAAFAPELALAGVPGVGEAVVVAVVVVGVGYLADKYLLPTVDKEIFRAEHWAYHEGAHDVAKAADAVGDEAARVGDALGRGADEAARHAVKSFKTGFGLWG